MDCEDDCTVYSPFLPTLVFPSSPLAYANTHTAHVALEVCHCHYCSKHDRQCAYKDKLKRVRARIVAVEKQ